MKSEFWGEIARRWSLIGPPLRPSADDVERIAASLAYARGPVRRLLVLGATPDYAALAERIGAHALAVDLSGDMLQAVWPLPGRAARGDWLHMPFADASFDAVLGDGILTLLGFPADHARLVRHVRRVLRPGGVFAMRAFCDAHRDEGPERVHALLESDRIANFHELRFRFLMALQQDTAQGIAVRKLWEYWQRDAPDLSGRLGRPGWSEESLTFIARYEHSAERFRFPTPDEIRDLVGKELHEVEHSAGAQGFDALWPTFAWRA